MASEPTQQSFVLHRQGRNMFAFLTLSLAALIFVLILRSPSPPALYILLAGIYSTWAIDALYRRLTVTPQGLTYRKLLSTTSIRWEDALSVVAEGTLSQQEILLAQPSTPGEGRAVRIPLTYFSRSWRTDALGKVLVEKAPQVFAPVSPPAA